MIEKMLDNRLKSNMCIIQQFQKGTTQRQQSYHTIRMCMMENCIYLYSI